MRSRNCDRCSASDDLESELSGVSRRPSLHNDLFVRIEVDGIVSLCVKVAEETVFPSAKRGVCHRSGDTDIDPDVAD